MDQFFNLGLLDNRYILLKEVESSFISTIYIASDSLTNQIRLVKIFHKKYASFVKEMELNKKIHTPENPFFIKYINSSSGPLINDDIEENNVSYIILEFASKGNLLKYVNLKEKGFDERICKIIIAKILKAIQFLHERGICYRNLQLKNIFLDGENYNIKLGNLEFCSFFINKMGQKILCKDKIKIESIAPELLKGKSYDGEKVDIFDLGILLLSLITGVQYNFDIIKKLYTFIKKNKVDNFWNLLEIKELSPEFKKLFIRMVNINPKKRPSIGEIYNDEWMNEINTLNEEELNNFVQELRIELRRRDE